ncbi:MAG: hypothetical protein ACFB2W_04120 [Leptolyngbyaceae cyanobacterium]
MSQSRQSKTSAIAPAGTSPEADTLVETYAEDLMDEIFDDVDRILAGDESAVYAESTVAAPERSAFNAETVTVPAMIVPFTGDPAVEPRIAAPITEAAPSDTPADSQDTPADKSRKQKPWKKILVGAVCLSALTGFGVWAYQQSMLEPATAPAVPAASPASQEADFGQYLVRALQVIGGERSAQVESQSPDVVATVPPAAEPSGSAAQPGGVIERVFVPMLQPSTGANRTTPNTAAALPAPGSALPAPGQSGSDTTAPTIAAANSYELVGILELGNRSAALFEIDGSSQRVYIGETVGGSGWSIVSIGNEEVVVRRNGEVRSIYIGQQF